ncbi:non-ribosomal peptide synthetase, partial [Tahibacter harae]
MTPNQILTAYKAGRLSTQELQEHLRQLRDAATPSPLSEGQKGLWVLNRMAADDSAYNLPLCFQFDAGLDLDLFRQACELLLEQHPMLRAVIEVTDGVPAQRLAQQPLAFSSEDLGGADDAAVLAVLKDKARAPFSLTEGPLLRVHVVRRGAAAVALFVVHHIVFDGSSVPLLLASVLQNYAELARGETPLALAAGPSYRDFVEWERQLLADGAPQHRDYWRRQLAGPLPVLELPADRTRSATAKVDARSVSRRLPAALAAQVRQAAAAAGVSSAVLLLGVYKWLLFRYSGQRDLIVGMPSAGRPQPRFERVIGYFVNMLPLRSAVDPAQAFGDFVSGLQLTLADALDHAAYPFARVVKDAGALAAGQRSPLFQVAYEFQNAAVVNPGAAPAEPGALGLQALSGLRQEGEYELVLEVVEQADGFELHLKYDAAVFGPARMQRMLGHYAQLLQQVLAAPQQPLQAHGLLDAQEQEQLRRWNAKDEPAFLGHSLPGLFDAQAARTPEAVAVSFGDEALSYRELQRRASALAAHLLARGVAHEDRVGLCVQRSLDLIVGLLGIQKAGAAYVPLDPDYPAERLRYMVADSGMRLLLTQSALEATAQAIAAPGVDIVALDQLAPLAGSAAALPAIDPGQLAYVMYTSGSTGNPKGVMIGQQALANFLLSMQREPGITRTDRLYAVTTFSFDIAGLELYLPLISGAHCHISTAGDAQDPRRLLRALAQVRPTIMQATPTTWALLFQAGWTNPERMKLLCGGEALPEPLRDAFVASGSEAWNLYGPTETTIWSTVCRILPNDANAIGEPIANTAIFILDAAGQPAPVGVPGELGIAGDGLARGYWNLPEMSAQRFAAAESCGGVRLYRTGDLARRREDGGIECLGRIDAQVKLRGYRIELGEIEARLAEDARIAQCVVGITEHDGHRQLTAFCVPAQPPVPGQHAALRDSLARELRPLLRQHLPDYMIPARFVLLDALPLTPNGKVDRKRVASLGDSAAPAAAPVESTTASRAEIEQRLGLIWQRALDNPSIRPDDGFFEIGGDSVLAVTVADRIAAEFGTEFSVTDVFRFSTLRRIAAHLAAVAPAAAGESAATAQAVPASVAAATPLAADCRDSLAIVGMSCQVPGAADHHAFWRQLLAGESGMRRLGADELAAAGVPAALAAHPRYVPVRSAIAGRELFDADFFRVNPRDAELMDPQLRLLLQHAWAAVEDAGYTPGEIRDTSVFVAVGNNGYQSLASASAQAQGGGEQYVSWVLAQSGSAATIISHRLGLKGPSFAVHSNCSSSLVGLYAAQQSLQSGECRQALVGAASLPVWPGAGYLHQKGLNFSSDGRVKTFDDSADGMVAGEGVAVILLKRAADAVADGDHIYALLRAVALNNDGADKVGFYAPSAEGQAEVIAKALRQAGVPAESIACVEAHGTGTELGDPIELSALGEVYRRETAAVGYCGLGSVKSNIGHLDTAAGLAGCIKLALSLDRGALVPTLHYTTPNRKFDLAASPFYVLQHGRDWPRGTLPRRAGLSSFGIGGTNAHAILEEAPLRAATAALPAPFLLPLSARTAERLQVYAQRLADFLPQSGLALADVAYTFQVGREAMPARAVFVAADLAELVAKLGAFARGERGIAGCIAGEAGGSESLLEDEDSASLVERWISGRKLSKLGKAWVRGLEIDWRRLYAGTARPQRVSLPTYPFLPEPHVLALPAQAGAGVAMLHPLVQRNTSDLHEQRYSSTFDGSEFFLRDHQIHGKRVLPGVAYLELARAAVEQALGAAAGGEGGTARIRLKNVVWPRPVTVEDQPVNVHIRLRPGSGGEIDFEIYSGEAAEERVHCQGRALVAPPEPAPQLDLAALRAASHESLQAELSYERLPAIGFVFGPGMRANQVFNLGVDAQGQATMLAEIRLPDCVRDTRGDYVLHPSIMEAAIGALPIGAKAAVPFVLAELDVFGPCKEQVWAYIRHAAGSDEVVQRFDLDLCDADGRVDVRLRGYSRRAFEAAPAAESADSVLLLPYWQEQPAVAAAAAAVRRRVLLTGAAAATALPDAVALAQDGADAADYFTRCAHGLRDLLTAAPASAADPLLLQVVVPREPGSATLAGLAALLKSARQENRHLQAQLIETDAWADSARLAAQLDENAASGDTWVRCEAGRRLLPLLRELAPAGDAPAPWIAGGVHLLAGGAGRLGQQLAADIAAAVPDAVIVLTGRGALTPGREQELAPLRPARGSLEYHALDLADADAVAALVGALRQRHGRLDVVVHLAGVLADNYLHNKSGEELQRVLAPKVRGLANLDAATAALPLQAFIAFSSVVGEFGNAGQADYAAANAFVDALIAQRAALAGSGARQGRSLSVNWPLWRDGGMRMDAASERQMRQTSGAMPLSSAAGFALLRQAWHSGETRVVVLHGHGERLRQRLFGAPAAAAAPARPADTAAAGALLAPLLESLAQIVVNLIKIRRDAVNPEAELNSLGFDSISLTEFSNRLNREFELELTPTVFFEFPTLRGLAGHLLAEHGAALAARLGLRPAGAAPRP